MNKNYAAPRQHTSRTNLIRHCKITALYGITKGEISNIYAPNKIRAEFLIEKKESRCSLSPGNPQGAYLVLMMVILIVISLNDVILPLSSNKSSVKNR